MIKQPFNYLFDFAEILFNIDKYSKQHYYHREVSLYRKILYPLKDKIYYRTYSNSNDQYFETNVFITDNKSCHYTMVWDVQKALHLIKEKNMLPVQYNVEDYKSNFEDTNIMPSKAISAQFNKDPVIFVKWPGNLDVLIDGNHRYYNALKSKRKTIPAYVLSIEESMQCMLNEDFRSLFKIHHNLLLLQNRRVLNSSSPIGFSDSFDETKLFSLHKSGFSRFISSILLFLQF